MDWLDIVIAVVLVVSFLIGLRLGLIKAVFALVGLFLSIFLAGRFYAQLAGIFISLSDQLARLVAYVVILVVVMIIVAILAGILSKFLSIIMLGWLNHLGGAVFGMFVGGLLFAAILAIWVNYGSGGGIASHSVLARFLLKNFPLVLALLPSEFSHVKSFFQ